MMLRLVVFLLMVGVILTAAAIVLVLLWKTVGWLTIPIALVMLIAAAWGIKILIGRLIMKLFEAPFRLKGAVLRDARTTVHEVKRLAAGPQFHEYQIDLTIQPNAEAATPFRSWNPHEIELVPFGTKPGPPPDSKDDDEDEERNSAVKKPWQVAKVEFWYKGQFVDKLPGEDGDQENAPPLDENEPLNRVRLLACVPPDHKRVAFRYYFEVFGDVSLS